jgi:hypothetical protein
MCHLRVAASLRLRPDKLWRFRVLAAKRSAEFWCRSSLAFGRLTRTVDGDLFVLFALELDTRRTVRPSKSLTLNKPGAPKA